MNDGGVAKADVHRGRAHDILQRTIKRCQAESACLLGPRLHVRLVDLHDVRAGIEQIANLLVQRGGVVHRG